MLFVYGGCCLYFALYCAAAAACTFDPRMPVLPVLRFLLSYGCCLNRIRCCMAATASAYGCAAVFVCCARGLMEAGFLRYGLASGMRGCASAVRFFALASARSPLFSLFSSLFALSHVLFFRRCPLRSPLRAASLPPLFLSSFPLIPFLPLIPLSLRAFPGGRLSSVDLLISGGIYYII